MIEFSKDLRVALQNDGLFNLTSIESLNEFLDRDKRTILINLILNKNTALARKIIPFISNLDHRDKNGETALHHAARVRNKKIALELINANCTIDIADNYGNSPLWRAVFESKGDNSFAQLLLSNGANPNLKNNHDVSPKELANTIGNYDIKLIFK